MAPRYRKHYSLDEARALLPQVRVWLHNLSAGRRKMAEHEEILKGFAAKGDDIGGRVVHRWLESVLECQIILKEFKRREIQIKDLDRGLIDFPAYVGGKEVFLCWEHGEEDIEYWHDLDAGFAGREKLE